MTDYAIEGHFKQIACDYKALPQTVSVGSQLFIEDKLVTEVTEVHEVSSIIINSILITIIIGLYCCFV